LESIPDYLKNIMGPNEQIQLYIKQKIYHPKINVDSVVLTNERLILRHPHALGIKKDYTDYNYQDIANVVMDKGVLRSTLKLTLRFGGEPLELPGLPNADAQKAYGLIRESLLRFQSPFSAMATGVPPMMRQPVSPVGFAGVACRNCGSPIPAGQKFCGNCGQPV